MEAGHELLYPPLELPKGLVCALVRGLIDKRGGEVALREDGAVAVAAHADVETQLGAVVTGLFGCGTGRYLACQHTGV